ncbi:uncharacterized protein LOC132202059 isoform X2 [Neocloeon triangulifer]|uniref:uncharacterized protein LOC132202059 isoform X2 n=1 Tax=Neocloeon triangulifer TaxID=2078957 RepID=UPI00286F8955|nr:uncharacterized protein LOC132202059 isoform X2 [Neocloeon triangulifer]
MGIRASKWLEREKRGQQCRGQRPGPFSFSVFPKHATAKPCDWSAADGTFQRQQLERPLVTVAQFKAKQDIEGRAKVTVTSTKNAKLNIRKTRNLNAYGEDSVERRLDPAIANKLLNLMSLPLEYFKGNEPQQNELRKNLLETMINCRGEIACALTGDSKGDDQANRIHSHVLLKYLKQSIKLWNQRFRGYGMRRSGQVC